MIARFFKFTERKTTFGTEVIAGATTFLAMAYIVFVNPNILAVAGMDKTALITVTCLVTALATMMTGIFAKCAIDPAARFWLSSIFFGSAVADVIPRGRKSFASRYSG